jgi:hypothetical protein
MRPLYRSRHDREGKLKTNEILLSTGEELDSAELLRDGESEHLKSLLNFVTCDGNDLEKYMIDQVSLTNDVNNFRFVLTSRLSELKRVFAPVRANIENEILQGLKNKPTAEQLENRVKAHEQAAAYIEQIENGESLIEFIKGLEKVLDQRGRIVLERHYAHRKETNY